MKIIFNDVKLNLIAGKTCQILNRILDRNILTNPKNFNIELISSEDSLKESNVQRLSLKGVGSSDPKRFTSSKKG